MAGISTLPAWIITRLQHSHSEKKKNVKKRSFTEQDLVPEWFSNYVEKLFSKSNGFSPKWGVSYGDFVWFLFLFLPQRQDPCSGKMLHRFSRRYFFCKPSRVLPTELTTHVLKSSPSHCYSARWPSTCSSWTGVWTPLACKTSQDASGRVVCGSEN